MRWPWQRRRPKHPHILDHRLLIAQLVQSDDRLVRAQHGQELDDLMATALDASVDAAQVAVWAMERRLSGQLQQQFGVTNEMIGDAVTGVGRLHGQMTAMEGMFSAFGERLTSVEADIVDLQAYRDELPSAERRELITELRQNTAQLADITKRLERIEDNQRRIIDTPSHDDDTHERG